MPSPPQRVSSTPSSHFRHFIFLHPFFLLVLAQSLSVSFTDAQTCTSVNPSPQTFLVDWGLGAKPAMTIRHGDSLEFVNVDGLYHTVTDGSCGQPNRTSADRGCRPHAFNALLDSKGETYFATFQECGVWWFYCSPHASMAGSVTVLDGNATLPASDANNSTTEGTIDASAIDLSYQLAISHGALMFTAFGVLLPAGGFLAASGRLRAHYVTQSTGLLCALGGIVCIFTGTGGSFANIHNVVGMVLVVMALFIQPFAVFMSRCRPRSKASVTNAFMALHRRNGQMLVFFGIANVFLGLMALNVSTTLRVAYGCWVGLMILIYMLYQPSTSSFSRGKAPGWGAAKKERLTLGGVTTADSQDTPRVVRTSIGGETKTKSVFAFMSSDLPEEEAEEEFGFGAESGPVKPLSRRASSGPVGVNDMSLAAILSSTRDAIIGSDTQGTITSWSAGAEQMFGYTAEEAKGQSLQILMPGAYKRRHQNGIDRQTVGSVRKNGKPVSKTGGSFLKHYNNIYSVRGLSKSGHEFPIEVSVTSFEYKGKLHFTGIIRDLSKSGGGGSSGSGGDGVGSGKSSGAHNVQEALVSRLKTQAQALGAAMQQVHGLSDMTQITRRELRNILTTTVKEQRINLGDESDTKIGSLVDALMHEGARGGNSIYYVDLVGLLGKHGLTVGETGHLEQIKTAVGSGVDAQKMGSGQPLGERLRVWLTNNWSAFMWLFLFYGINIFLFTYQAVTYANSGSSAWVVVARGAGLTLDFNCALIVVPMCRKVLAWMRATWLVRIIPFDASVAFHKLVGWNILLGAIVHTVGHFGNYASLPEPFAHYLFGTNAGLTGFVIWMVMIVMYTGASEYVRRGDAKARDSSGWGLRRLRSHAVFFLTHHLFVVFFAMLIIHGLHFINPNFWKFFIGPGSIYVLERVYRDGVEKREELRIVKAVTLAGKVTNLVVTKPTHWKAKPGQYIFIQIPAVSRFEWHPFTLTSCPEDEHISVMIRSVGDWTGDVHDLFKEYPVYANNANVAGSSSDGFHEPNATSLPPIRPEDLPIARVDGPYGAATEEVFDFEYAVLVGAGIGSTPAASILRHIKYRLEQVAETGERCRFCKLRLRKLYFVWSNRDAGAFQWFADYLSEIQEAELAAQSAARRRGKKYEPLIDIRVFFTAVKRKKQDLSTVLLQVGAEAAQKKDGVDVISNLRSITSFGRPNFPVLFDELRAKHPGETFGVFFCGPAMLGRTLKKACHEASGHATKFVYKQEIF